jgi:hypothetical protein
MGKQRRAGALEGGLAMQWRDASGKSSIRGLIALVLIVGLVYVGMKFIPVRAAALQFSDAINEEVLSAGGRRRTTDDEMMQSLLERAGILGLPIRRQDITIQRQGTKYIVISADYTVVIELIGGYTWDWSFSPSHGGPLF